MCIYICICIYLYIYSTKSQTYVSLHLEWQTVHVRYITSHAIYYVYIIHVVHKSTFAFRADGFKTHTFDDFTSQPYDLIINMTSAGLEDDSLPCPSQILEQVIPTSKACVDVIYGKETPFLKLVKTYKKPTKDGSDMLLYQGIIAFEYFTEHAYTFEEIKAHMQKAFIL